MEAENPDRLPLVLITETGRENGPVNPQGPGSTDGLPFRSQRRGPETGDPVRRTAEPFAPEGQTERFRYGKKRGGCRDHFAGTVRNLRLHAETQILSGPLFRNACRNPDRECPILSGFPGEFSDQFPSARRKHGVLSVQPRKAGEQRQRPRRNFPVNPAGDIRLRNRSAEIIVRVQSRGHHLSCPDRSVGKSDPQFVFRFFILFRTECDGTVPFADNPVVPEHCVLRKTEHSRKRSRGPADRHGRLEERLSLRRENLDFHRCGKSIFLRIPVIRGAPEKSGKFHLVAGLVKRSAGDHECLKNGGKTLFGTGPLVPAGAEDRFPVDPGPRQKRKHGVFRTRKFQRAVFSRDAGKVFRFDADASRPFELLRCPGIPGAEETDLNRMPRKRRTRHRVIQEESSGLIRRIADRKHGFRQINDDPARVPLPELDLDQVGSALLQRERDLLFGFRVARMRMKSEREGGDFRSDCPGIVLQQFFHRNGIEIRKVVFPIFPVCGEKCVEQGLLLDPPDGDVPRFRIAIEKRKDRFLSGRLDPERIQCSQIPGKLGNHLPVSTLPERLQRAVRLKTRQIDGTEFFPLPQFPVQRDEVVFFRHPEAQGAVRQKDQSLLIGKRFQKPPLLSGDVPSVPSDAPEQIIEKIRIDGIGKRLFLFPGFPAEKLEAFPVAGRALPTLRRRVEDREPLPADRRRTLTDPVSGVIVRKNAQIGFFLQFPGGVSCPPGQPESGKAGIESAGESVRTPPERGIVQTEQTDPVPLRTGEADPVIAPVPSADKLSADPVSPGGNPSGGIVQRKKKRKICFVSGLRKLEKTVELLRFVHGAEEHKRPGEDLGNADVGNAGRRIFQQFPAGWIIVFCCGGNCGGGIRHRRFQRRSGCGGSQNKQGQQYGFHECSFRWSHQ